jgi:hypothetical protein
VCVYLSIYIYLCVYDNWMCMISMVDEHVVRIF